MGEAKKPWERETWDAVDTAVVIRWQGTGPGGAAEFVAHAGEDPREWDRARARLAAAAPELYRALDGLLGEILRELGPMAIAQLGMVDIARAALRKARGE